MTAARKATGPAKGGTYLSRAQSCWGDKLPDWVSELACALDAEVTKGGNQRTLGNRLTLTASTLSAVIGKTYPGALNKIEGKVRGKLMSAIVACPALGMEIGRADCVNNQALKPSAASPDRFKLARTCPTCPNFLGGKS